MELNEIETRYLMEARNVMKTRNVIEDRNLMETRNVMDDRNDLRQNYRNEIETKVNEIFSKLENKLPPGWKVNEASVRVENESYYVGRIDQILMKERNQIDDEEDIDKICDEFTQMDKNMPPGWKLKKGSVVKDDEVLDIISKIHDQSSDSELDEDTKYDEDRRFKRRNYSRSYSREKSNSDDKSRRRHDQRYKTRRRVESRLENHPQGWKPNQKRNQIHKVNFSTSTSNQE